MNKVSIKKEAFLLAGNGITEEYDYDLNQYVKTIKIDGIPFLIPITEKGEYLVVEFLSDNTSRLLLQYLIDNRISHRFDN